MGVGSPEFKRDFVEKALATGLKPAPTIVHPRAIIQGNDCELGVGGLITPGCALTTNIKIGDYVLLDLNCTVGHDTIISDYTSVSRGCHRVYWFLDGELIWEGRPNETAFLLPIPGQHKLTVVDDAGRSAIVTVMIVG